MSASWMLYAIVVGALLTLGVIVIERFAHERARTSRFLWVVALAAALVWPVATTMGAGAKAAPTPAPVASEPATNSSAPAVATPTLIGAAMRLPPVMPSSPSIDDLAAQVIAFAPFLMLIALLIEVGRVSRARRRWHRETVDGVSLFVSPNFGPAIVGTWRPSIVIPAWVLELPPAERALVLAHETEHLAASDSWWLGLAFIGVVLAPWNLSLWWLVRRVRLSIEVECDQRVLRRGHDVAGYANLLLETGRRTSGRSLLIAGFAERRSMLRARIDRMTMAVRASALTQVSRLAMASVLVVAACTVRPSKAATALASGFPIAALVGDSIVNDDDMRKPTKAAHDLPKTFEVVATIPATVGSGPLATCASALIDERDGTELLLEAATAKFRPDTAVDRNSALSRSVAFYSVRPIGRYGVESGEWLRVGCPRAREKDLMGTVTAGALRPAPLDAVLRDSLGVEAGALVQLDSRLDIAVAGDTAATSRQRARQIAALAWRQLGGPSSALDTITVRVEPHGDFKPGSPVTSIQSIRWVFYPKQDDLANR